MTKSLRNWIVGGLLLLGLAGCATPPPAAAIKAGTPYTRVARTGSGAVGLEIALRQFVPEQGKGPALWLVGVAHMGDTNYYGALQRHLDAQSLVLFEGVDNEDHQLKKKLRTKPVEGQPVTERASLQTTFAKSLGLAFQMDAIDYDRPHFRNSDLTIEQLYRLMQRGNAVTPQAGGGRSDNSLDQLVGVMDGSSFLGAAIQMGLKIIGSSAKLQALTRLAMIETLGQFDMANVAEMKGVPPELKDLVVVLIEERNKQVVHDVREAVQTLGRRKTVAVFYGAGHMQDLEKRLAGELNYQPVKEIWLPAFSVDPKAAGLTTAEVEMVNTLVRWQMEALKP